MRILLAAICLCWSFSALAQNQNPITPTSPSGSLTLATGGTAQTLFAAAEVSRGCVITNPTTATESIWVNFFTTAVGSDGNTSIPLTPGQSVACPAPLNTAVSWIAATTSHKINAFRW